MIVDAHQHFWDLGARTYSWLKPEFEALYRNFAPADLEPLLRASGVDSTVVVQAAWTLEDTDSMLAQADDHPFIGAVVGWLPLADTRESERLLERRYGSHRKYRGVRHLNHDEPDPDWLVRPEVVASLALLERRDLVFEVVSIFPLHLGHIPTLAEAHPNLRLVIDHLAKPPISSGDLDPWKDAMTKAASYPNVYAKVSGLNTAVGSPDWSAEDLVPSIGHSIDVFGPDRLMFGSDWPVLELAGNYAKVFDETTRALDMLGLDDAATAAIMGGTAKTLYSIEEVPW